MFYIFDMIVYAIILFILIRKRIEIVDGIYLIIWALLLYPVFLIDLNVLRFLYMFVILSGGSLFFSRNISKSLNLSFLFLFSSLTSLLYVHSILPMDYFDLVSVDFYNVIFYILVKYLLFIPVFFILTAEQIFGFNLGTVLNRTSMSIFISVLLIYIIYDIQYFEQLNLDSSIFISFLFVIPIILYSYTLLILGYFSRQINKIKFLHVEASVLLDDIETVLEENQIQIIHKIQTYMDKGDITAFQKFSQDFLEENFVQSKKQFMSGIEDNNITLLIHSKIEKYPSIIFDIVIDGYDFYQISSEEKNFLEMFGIIFDNAIEGALLSEEKIVRLLFKDCKITISNTYPEDGLQNYYSKESNKGSQNRINGLKLLDYLNEKSDICILSKVEDMIVYEMLVVV